MYKTSTKNISRKKYEKLFRGKEEKALNQALDIRKFEIELYWKRATYFWTFIGATLAGFFAVRASTITHKEDLSAMLSCLGFVFSFAWFNVNRGSKYWQENWEKHVDLLENKVHGPLYKVRLSRNTDMGVWDSVNHFLTGPNMTSVSKINQIISIYVTLLWGNLLAYSLEIVKSTPDDKTFLYTTIGLSLFVCLLFLTSGRSYKGGHYHTAELRKSRINPR